MSHSACQFPSFYSRSAGFSWRWLALAVLLIVLPIAGCKPAYVGAHGRVTLDGEPLDEAAILFVPVGVEQKKTGAAVKNGQYELPRADGLTVGRYRVEFVDNPPITHEPPPHGSKHPPKKRRPFPSQYAHNSKIECEITSADRGSRQLDFELKSK